MDAFRVGDWIVLPDQNRLEHEGHTVCIQPKTMDVLCCLAERQGKVVTPQQLLDAVWPDTLPEEQVVRRRIAELREVFGDDARAPDYIETRPKRGYRLLLPTSTLTSGSDSSIPDVPVPRKAVEVETSRPGPWALRWAIIAVVIGMIGAVGWWADRTEVPVPQPVAIAQAPRIAVLPFVNMSNDAEQEYFSDGVSEDILNALVKNPALIVRPRSSSFVFKGSTADPGAIGQQLDVSYLVEGSVRRVGSRIRLGVRLVDVANNRTIWSDRYDREVSDIFLLQDELTGKILSALEVRLGLREPRTNAVDEEAYDAFLRGLFMRERGDLVEADRWFERAVTLEPDYADAWAMRAVVNAYLTALGYLPNDRPNFEARQAFIRKALATDPSNVNALTTRALDRFYRERDFQGAIAELVRLSAEHPNEVDTLYWLSYVFMAIGRGDLARRTTARAVHLAPLSRFAMSVRAYGLAIVGPEAEFRSASETLEKLGVQTPDRAAAIGVLNNDPDEIRAALRSYHGPWNATAALLDAIASFVEGDHEEARRIALTITSADEYVRRYERSRAALIEDDIERALLEYRRGIEEGEQVLIQRVHGALAERRLFPEFYAHPGYQKMLEDFGLDPASTARIEIPELPF